jgi:hypothetical protein
VCVFCHVNSYRGRKNSFTLGLTREANEDPRREDDSHFSVSERYGLITTVVPRLWRFY